MMNIIFGTKKLGQVAAKVVNEKYPDHAVVTVEGVKEAKKSRRILFNSKAAEILGLNSGEIQQIIFGSVEDPINSEKSVLLMNLESIGDTDQDMTIYKTSKNKVSFGENNEKAKAITSSHMCGEVFRFLELDDSTPFCEFSLVSFPNPDVDAYQLAPLDVSSGAQVTSDSISVTEADNTPAIETNNGVMTGEDLSAAIKEEVTKAEQESPVVSDWA